MPFTVSHAAAALPIRRVLPAIPMAPLVVGTMAPDLEYMIRFGFNGGQSHTAIGLFLFCLPAGLVAWALFEWWIRPALDWLLPPTVVAVLPPRPSILAAAAAVLLGAASHVAWDSFTHPAGWSVRQWPALAGEPFLGWPWFRMFQHGSSLGGALVLAACLRRLRPLVLPRGSIGPWLVVGGCAIVGAILNEGRSPRGGFGPRLAYAAIGAMSTGVVAVLLVTAVLRSRPRPGSPG